MEGFGVTDVGIRLGEAERDARGVGSENGMVWWVVRCGTGVSHARSGFFLGGSLPMDGASFCRVSRTVYRAGGLRHGKSLPVWDGAHPWQTH